MNGKDHGRAVSTTDTELIRRLYSALLLTKSDAEHHGFTYGTHSVCVKAIWEARDWLMEHGEIVRPKMIIIRRGERSVGK